MSGSGLIRAQLKTLELQKGEFLKTLMDYYWFYPKCWLQKVNIWIFNTPKFLYAPICIKLQVEHP